MISLNRALESVGIDLRRARLVRHQDRRAKTRLTPHDLWLAGDGRFEAYQRLQTTDRFRDAVWVLSFVATPEADTLFVGAYRVHGVGQAPAGMIDPLTGKDVSEHSYYDLRLDGALAEQRGRMTIDWGPGFRSWIQRPHRRDRAILQGGPIETSTSMAIAALANEPTSNADWSRDEHILALDLYLADPASPPPR